MEGERYSRCSSPTAHIVIISISTLLLLLIVELVLLYGCPSDSLIFLIFIIVVVAHLSDTFAPLRLLWSVMVCWWPHHSLFIFRIGVLVPTGALMIIRLSCSWGPNHLPRTTIIFMILIKSLMTSLIICGTTWPHDSLILIWSSAVSATILITIFIISKHCPSFLVGCNPTASLSIGTDLTLLAMQLFLRHWWWSLVRSCKATTPTMRILRLAIVVLSIGYELILLMIYFLT